MDFAFFDPFGDVEITRGDLPHWYQPGVTYFITFRSRDSIPQEVAEQWHAQREMWLRSYGIRPDRPGWKFAFERLPKESRHEFHATFSKAFMEYLDQGAGECWLRDPKIAAIVAEALHHFDGERYLLSDYVVMPNHVHVLAQLLAGTTLEKVCYSWKHYTARKINVLAKQQGRYWQDKSFDHLVRGPKSFERFREYIVGNPVRAGLKEGEYLLWRRP